MSRDRVWVAGLRIGLEEANGKTFVRLRVGPEVYAEEIPVKDGQVKPADLARVLRKIAGHAEHGERCG